MNQAVKERIAIAVQTKVTAGDALVHGTPRKPPQSARNNRGTSPAGYNLRNQSGLIVRLWIKDGKYIRQISKNFGVRVREVEDILREACA